MRLGACRGHRAAAATKVRARRDRSLRLRDGRGAAACRTVARCTRGIRSGAPLTRLPRPARAASVLALAVAVLAASTPAAATPPSPHSGAAPAAATPPSPHSGAAPTAATPPSPQAGAAPTAAARTVPPLFEVALPARVTLIAWLKVAGAPAEVDLDLRVEVVMAMSCGDRLAGLMRAGGPTLEGPDRYEVVIERRAIGECKKEPTRIGARTAIRMQLREGETKELLVGPQSFEVARSATGVLLDGSPPEGDVAGAPPTARPTTLVAGEASAASLLRAAREPTDPGAARAAIRVTAKWPSCAGAPLGLLGRGDASTRFTLTRFQPIASAPLDQPCRGRPAVRSADLETTLRVPRAAAATTIQVGAASLAVSLPPAPRGPPAPAPAAR